MRAVAGHVALAMERMRLMKSLERHAAEAQAASLAKSQFVASMSHELRTPMNAILGMVGLALAAELPPSVRDYVQTAKESAELLLELLNEILDFSRLEAGRFELERISFSSAARSSRSPRPWAFKRTRRASNWSAASTTTCRSTSSATRCGCGKC